MEVSLPYKPEKLDVPTYDAQNPKDAEIELSHLDCHLPLTEEPTNYPVPTSTVRGNPRREDTDYRAVIRDEKDFAKVSRYIEEEHPGKMASP
jgi:predicted DNA binding protein